MSEAAQNVEDDTPAPEPPAPPVAAAPPAEPATPPEEDADLADPELLKDEAKLRAILAETSRVRRQNRELKPQAERAAQLEQELNQTRPYVDFLKNNQNLMQRPAPAAEPAPQDPMAATIAAKMDLYTPEGKPDVARGAELAQMLRGMAQQVAQQTIAPMQEHSAQQRSAHNFQVALQTQDAAGRMPSPQALAAVWRTVPANQSADPNVAAVLALTALGLDSVSTKPAPQAPAQSPVVTESQGGARPRAALSQLEASVAKDRGVSDAKWQDLTKGFQSGRSHQLED